MLLRFKVRNYLSFYEEVTFDMFPNLKRTTFQDHIYVNHEVPLLKQAAIYGANGSGKSNLIKAIDFMKQFATNKDALSHKYPYHSAFRLKGNAIKEDPLSFAIEFSHTGIYFIYTFEVSSLGNVLDEKLYLSGVGKKENQLIYSRGIGELETPTKLNKDVEKAIMNVLKSNPQSSLLSLNNEFPILDDKVQVAYDWFKDALKTRSLYSTNNSLIEEMDQDPKLLDFANRIIANIGLGIEKITLDKFEVNNRFNKKINDILEKEGRYTHENKGKVTFVVEEKDGKRMMKQFAFHQTGLEDYHGELSIESQSDGTSNVLNLIPILYDLIHNEHVYFIDEIENSIHPSLISALMQFYARSATKGQLIYSTHETELLNQKQLMRPDEVWFTEKHEGQTKLYSLNDFKEHNTINIKNGYLDGRYGSIPFIGNLSE